MKERGVELLEARRWLLFVGLFLGACALFYILPTQPHNGPGPIGKWTSVLPPILAVLMAICFRRLVLAMVSALVLGAFLAFGPLPWVALPAGFRAFIWSNLTTEFNLYIFAFTFSLVGMVHVMTRSGGLQGMLDLIVKVARGARSTRIATGLMGLSIFFDDYANAVVVGTTMRKLSDRWRVSREKLAYIVDSTTAPVAGLAVVSTWIAFEVGLFNDLARGLGLGVDGYHMFISALPFRFYCMTALGFVFIGAALNRDFGPMYRAEARSLREGKVVADGAKALASRALDDLQPEPDKPRYWYHAFVPITCVLLGVLVGILVRGRGAVHDAGLSLSFFNSEVWRVAIGAVGSTNAGSGIILFWAAMAGTFAAILLPVAQKVMTIRAGVSAWCKALPTMKLAFAILLLAWAIKSVCADTLHTDKYLASVLGDSMPIKALPLATFLLAAGISFATGTSWGTMGILLPVALPLAYSMGAWELDQRLFFWLTAAAVLDGAIFGDHISPISDTTVLSSIASGCDHIDHVVTQAPYGMTCMILAGVAGYAGVAAGLPVWLAYVVLAAGVAGVFVVIGTPLPAAGK